MAEELSLIEAWLYATLAGDSTLTDMLGVYTDPTGAELGPSIFSGAAAEGAGFPAVLIKWISETGGGDLYVNGAQRVWTTARYLITAVDERRDYEGLSPIASRIDALLTIETVIPVSGGNINRCTRESPYQRPIYEGANQEFRERGAFWIITAQAV